MLGLLGVQRGIKQYFCHQETRQGAIRHKLKKNWVNEENLWPQRSNHPLGESTNL